MKRGDNIAGYILTSDGSTRGGGRSFSAFAERDGKDYFIKQFTSPKYPVDGSPGSSKTKEKALERCKEFETRHYAIKEAILGKVASGGSVVAPLDFLRRGTFYYKIYDKIDIAALTSEEIVGLSLAERLLIMQVAAHSLAILHNVNIVHGDLKPDNILIKETEGGAFTAKVIDFDDAYFSGLPPQPETIVGDQVFYSPELLSYILNEDEKNNSRLAKEIGLRSDIFALGLVFCIFSTGSLPLYSRGGSAAEIVNAGKSLDIRATSVPPELAALITRMLARSPATRPSAQEVRDQLKVMGHAAKSATVKSKSEPTSVSSGLKIKGRVLSAAPSTSEKAATELSSGDSKVSKLKIKRRPLS